MSTAVDLGRFRPLNEAAQQAGLTATQTRWLARTRPGLAVKRLGRVLVDVERLAELAAPQPLAPAS